MESVLGRYRNLIILVGVLFLQVLGLAVQVKRSASRRMNHPADPRLGGGRRSLLSKAAWSGSQNGSGNLWHNYFYLRGVRAGKPRSQAANRADAPRAGAAQRRCGRRRTACNRCSASKNSSSPKTVAAQVIGSSGSELSRVHLHRQRVERRAQTGHGRDYRRRRRGQGPARVQLHTSQVLLINDQTSGVGAILEKSRLQGVLRGTPNGEVVLERVMSDETGSAGRKSADQRRRSDFSQRTAGGHGDQGLSRRELFLNIRVKPAADLSRLEEVLVSRRSRSEQPVAETARARRPIFSRSACLRCPTSLPARMRLQRPRRRSALARLKSAVPKALARSSGCRSARASLGCSRRATADGRKSQRPPATAPKRMPVIPRNSRRLTNLRNTSCRNSIPPDYEIGIQKACTPKPATLRRKPARATSKPAQLRFHAAALRRRRQSSIACPLLTHRVSRLRFTGSACR